MQSLPAEQRTGRKIVNTSMHYETIISLWRTLRCCHGPVSSAMDVIIEEVAFTCLFQNFRKTSFDQILAFFEI